MSAEAFQTVLSCDMRTGADGRSVEYARSGTGEPRWLNPDGTINRVEGVRPWADGYLYAEHAVRVASQAVRDEVMAGETGDHPDKRAQAARVLEAAADLVRVLALDAAHDAALTDEKWSGGLDKVATACLDLSLPVAEHDPLCPVAQAGGSCCPLEGGCECQCMCDFYAQVRADERRRYVLEGAGGDGWMTFAQFRNAVEDEVAKAVGEYQHAVLPDVRAAAYEQAIADFRALIAARTQPGDRFLVAEHLVDDLNARMSEGGA